MKYLILLLIMQFSLTSWAHVGQHEEEEECLPPGLPSEDKLLKAIRAPLQLWTSTGVQMQNAPCRRQNSPSVAEMEGVIQANRDGNFEVRTIHGVTLEDDPRVLKMFEHFTTNFRDKTPRNLQEQFKIDPSCNKVACALEKIWGSQYSKQMSYLYLEFGFNPSELSFANSERFTQKEMEEILIALNDFPKGMRPLSPYGNRQLTHYTRGKWDPEFRPGTFGSSDIQLYDPWTRAASWEKHQTIFHEVTHMIAQKSNLDYSQEWLSLGGWQGSHATGWRATKNNCMVGTYGKTDPGEDFAETAVAFRYNPSRLYKGCPEKYQYMKKIFKGAEYFAEESCVGK